MVSGDRWREVEWWSRTLRGMLEEEPSTTTEVKRTKGMRTCAYLPALNTAAFVATVAQVVVRQTDRT